MRLTAFFLLVQMHTFAQGFFGVIDANNIKTNFGADGTLFLNDTNYFEVPKNSNRATIFAGALWASGIDDGGVLRVAANTYKQSGTDFWPGPVANTYDSLYDTKYQNVWKVSKQEIQNHIANYNNANYNMPWVIENWPGNGNVLNGEANRLAPFQDLNSNGTYEPQLGEYPIILGDQAVFFLFNDVRDTHTESGGQPLGLEFHAMAYSFSDNTNADLYNTVFFKL